MLLVEKNQLSQDCLKTMIMSVQYLGGENGEWECAIWGNHNAQALRSNYYTKVIEPILFSSNY